VNNNNSEPSATAAASVITKTSKVRHMQVLIRAGIIASLVLVQPACAAMAQSATNLTALRGLAPVSALANTQLGRAALAANFIVTARIQDGTAHQPILLSFDRQQDLAVSDAFISR
jgi:hypothetical protein